ncbi:MAG: biopolymer transporter ExbD [Planctomycetota bacterium]
MKLSRTAPPASEEMNMTPLIDCVFQLLLFFMIVTDMTQANLESLQLPPALAAVPDEPDPKIVRPILNIPVSGKVIWRRETLYDPEQDFEDTSRLEAFLANQAKLMPTEHLNEKEGTGPQIPANPLMIRADENTEFKYIQRVMYLCAKKDIQIWKLELGAKDLSEEDEKKAESQEE